MKSRQTPEGGAGFRQDEQDEQDSGKNILQILFILSERGMNNRWPDAPAPAASVFISARQPRWER